VRQHLHDRMGSVSASRAELDAWARGRNPSVRTVGSRPMALSSRFGFASDTAQTAAISASGRRQRCEDSRDHTLREWPSSTGRTTAPGSLTTRPDPETRYSCQTVAGDRAGSPSSLRPPGSTLIFPCGRRTGLSSTTFGVRSQTNWTSGASLRVAELLNGSRRTIRACVIRSYWTGER
jgi:hypothetical protein